MNKNLLLERVLIEISPISYKECPLPNALISDLREIVEKKNEFIFEWNEGNKANTEYEPFDYSCLRSLFISYGLTENSLYHQICKQCEKEREHREDETWTYFEIIEYYLKTIPEK